MIIYGLKTCDTCRKAVKALDGAEMWDVREVPLPSDVLNRALQQFGDALVNTRSTTWRGLGEDERKRPQTDLLRAYPALMKRPLIAKGDNLLLGWTKDVQVALIG